MIRPVAQVEGRSQFHDRQTFQNVKDQRGCHIAACDQIIAMIPVLQGQSIWLYRMPEGQIAQRLKPLFNILNIFENYHGTSLSNRISAKQTCAISETLWAIVAALVDLGFGIHPLQNACGQDADWTVNLPSEIADMVESEDQENQIQNRNMDASLGSIPEGSRP